MPIKNANDLNQVNKKIKTKCSHVVLIDKTVFESNLDELTKDTKCSVCSETTNLWLCLHDDCKIPLCSNTSKLNDTSHKRQHHEVKFHSIMLDIKAKSIFCDLCNQYIDLMNNEPSLNELKILNNVSNYENDSPINENTCDNIEFYDCMNRSLNIYIGGDKKNDDEDDDSFGLSHKETTDNDNDSNVRGLVGLRNIGNTCYLNAALQALSNCPSLTNFFLECPFYVKSEKMPYLSQYYMKLIQHIWSIKDTNMSIAPIEIVQAIKYVNSTFKGYAQQDSQEFLLCLLDQLHEELKRVQINTSTINNNNDNDYDFDNTNCEDVNMSSQSDTDSYETCDSTPSSENNFLSNYESTINGDGPTILFSNERQRSSSSASETTDKTEKMENENDKELILNPKNLENYKTQPKKILTKKKSKSSIDNISEKQDNNGTGNSETKKKEKKDDKKSNKKDKKLYTSVISEIFDGKIISQVQCLECKRVSNTIETFQDLSLPIPNKEYLQALESKVMNKSAENSSKQYQTWRSWIMGFITGSFLWGPTIKLEDCLTIYFSEADLKDDNMYSCEKCKKLNNGIKYSKILKLPETLCIQLKRFRHEYMFSTKIGTYVEFPLKDLDMSTFLHKNCKNKSSKYDLCAIICHHGGSNSGHYTCYAFNHIDNEWYEYDDSYCSRTDEATVKNAQAYVLFYRKKNPQMDAVANELNDLLKQKPAKTKPYYISKQWINKLKYFSEPGPISNHDFLCAHGDVYPDYWPCIDQLVVPVNEDIYNYLIERFGIDDVYKKCNKLFPCKQCLIDTQLLHQRRYHERAEFLRLFDNNKHIKETNMYYSVYSISNIWFNEWKKFIEGKVKDPPGPINNFSVCSKNKNDTYDLNKNANVSDINKLCWDFFYSIYGGGPVLMRNILNKSYNPKSTQAIPTSSTSITKTLSRSISLSASPTASSYSTPSSLTSSKSLHAAIENDNSQQRQLSINQITSQNIINVNSNSNGDMFQIKQTKI